MTQTEACIVVLDGYTVNPSGDISWEALEGLGTLVVFDRTPEREIVTRGARADVLITNKTPISEAAIFALPQLRGIAVLATGINVVDIEAARSRNIPVCNVPSYSPASVAQHTIALLLELCHHVGHHDRAVKDGRWAKSPDFCFWDSPVVELEGKTLGIIGYGAIGQRVAQSAKGLGMRIYATPSRNATLTDGIRHASVDEILRIADVVSLHCPLTPETHQLICEKTLALMKPSALLLNTARGGLVEEAALARALNQGRIAGAGLDVLGVEPPSADNPLLSAANCIITPHMAWSSLRARRRMMEITADNVQKILLGAPQNVVNG